MKFENHIAYRFLNDDNLIMEIAEAHYKREWSSALNGGDISHKIHDLYAFLTPKDTKNYFVTNTVIDKLDMLKVKKNGDHFDWTVFNGRISDLRNTFIFSDNSLMKLVVQDDIMMFCYLKYEPYDKVTGHMSWTMFYLNKNTGELCEHFDDDKVKNIEEFCYKLLCFVYLTENDEVILPPNAKIGTRKSGLILNDIKSNITIINSRWNTDVVRLEKFGVRGHFAIRWVGEGRSSARLVFIEPFEKNGYTRKAKTA